MKKLTALLLCLAVVCGLAACSRNVGGKLEGKTGTTAGTQSESVGAGEVTGAVYTNEYFGIACELGEDWSFYDKAQLAQINSQIAETANDEQIRKALESGKAVFDMYATGSEGLMTINVVFEKLGAIAGVAMDEKSYVNVSLQTLGKSLEAAGMTDPEIEATTVNFCGREHAGIKVKCKVQGIDFYELMVCVKKSNYVAVVTFGTFLNNETLELAELFYDPAK